MNPRHKAQNRTRLATIAAKQVATNRSKTVAPTNQRGTNHMTDKEQREATKTVARLGNIPAVTVVPLDDVEVDMTFNVRQNYTEEVAQDTGTKVGGADMSPTKRLSEDESIKALADSIESEGQRQPVLVIRGDNGRYRLIEGFRRMRALRVVEKRMVELGAEKPTQVRIQVMDLDEKDAHYTNAADNIQRSALTSYDIAHKARFMRDTFGESGPEIARRFGLQDRNYVNNLMRAIDKLDPRINEQWRVEHPVARHNFLFSLLTLDHDDQWKKWCERTGTTVDASGQTIEGGEGDGEGTGTPALPKGPKRPAMSTLESAITAVMASKKPEQWKAGALEALNFATGKEPVIMGVYDPKESKAGRGVTAEEAKAATTVAAKAPANKQGAKPQGRRPSA